MNLISLEGIGGTVPDPHSYHSEIVSDTRWSRGSMLESMYWSLFKKYQLCRVPPLGT